MSRSMIHSRVRFIATVVAALTIALSLPGGPANADKPAIDPSWADGQLVYMIGPHLIPNAIATQPNLYAHSEELYLLVYPINNAQSNDQSPQTLPSGYQPNCNPCYHPGVPPQFAYHDHVLTGAPGLGNQGTAGQYKGPWKIILLVYNPAVALAPTFSPVTSVSDLDAAEAAGVFLPVNPDPNAANKYEIDTGNVLICPLVSPHA
ncbi:MAG: hypothetical protein JSR54_03040 [Proteobacteria bacterium]|nr:hypothetical protein [Pseudomonadota bacterium]